MTDITDSALVNWNVLTIPSCAIRCGLNPRTESPSRSTSPPSPRSKPVMTLKSVDLPAPFGPMSAVSEPRRTSKVAPLTAMTPPKLLETFCTERRVLVSAGTKVELLALAEQSLGPEDDERHQHESQDHEAKRRNP